MSAGLPSALFRQQRLRVPARSEISRRPLITERLILEPIETPAYRKFWTAVEASRASLNRWLPWVPLNDSPDASYRYTQACERDWDNGAALRFFIRERNESPIIGVVSLENCMKQHLSCELGYWLMPEYRGNGLMNEAAGRALCFAFQILGAHRIRCAAGEDNQPSRRVAERLGFLQEGIAREAEFVDGRWVTHVVYSLLRADGKAAQYLNAPSRGS